MTQSPKGEITQDAEGFQVATRTFIPAYEIWFTFDRSSGPGGQNVNKRSSRVTLWFDVDASPSLSQPQKQLIHTQLKTRINKEGILRMVASKHRTQAANRRTLETRFEEVVREALIEKPKRKKTKVPKSVKRKRISDKKHRSQVKESRRRPPADD